MRVVSTRVCRKGADIHPTQRYVGLYYWCAYWRNWDKVLAVDGIWTTVVEVDRDGNVVGEPRRHCTLMNACAFAERPFDVERG